MCFSPPRKSPGSGKFRLEECFRIWPANISIRDLVQPDTLITHSQVTDVFLLALAVHKGGKLATLDRRIATAAVQQGSEAWNLVKDLPVNDSIPFHFSQAVSPENEEVSDFRWLHFLTGR